jgi:peptidyl-prolyl cis-trans isomerase C
MTPLLTAGRRAPARLFAAFAALAAFALVSVAAVPAFADDPILAKVNGTEIHQSDLTVAEEEAATLAEAAERVATGT